MLTHEGRKVVSKGKNIVVPNQVLMSQSHDEQDDMNEDALISTADGQSLQLKRITSLVAPIELTVRHSDGGSLESFAFSLDKVDEDKKSDQKSGHYSMTVEKQDVETDPLLIVRQVRLMQGEDCARIDIIFSADRSVSKNISQCSKNSSSQAARDICTKIVLKDLEEVSAGRISFTLMSGHSKLYQKIEWPRKSDNANLEIFAKWTPKF